MRIRNPQTLKGWLPIHPVPGLMKPWKGVWPGQWSGEEKLGMASPLSELTNFGDSITLVENV